MTDARLQRIFSALLALFGSTIAFGWLAHLPVLVSFPTGTVPVVFNVGASFAITGLALLLAPKTSSRRWNWQTAAGIFLVLLGSASFLEHLLDRDFGVDLGVLHAWFNYGNVRAGRMAPNSAIGLITIGTIMVLMQNVQSRTRAVAVLGLTYGLLTIGLTGLAGYALGPDLLFGWALSARMAIPTALAMMLSAAALRFSWHSADWYQSSKYLREEQKIGLSGAAMVIVCTLTAGLTGFVAQQQAVQAALKHSLSETLHGRIALQQTIFDEAVANVRVALIGDRIQTASLDVLANPSGLQQQKKLVELAAQLRATDFNGIKLLDAQRRLVARSGDVHDDIKLQTNIDAIIPSRLFWSAGSYILQSDIPLLGGNQLMGFLVLEQTLQNFQSRVLGVEGMGNTTEIVICKPDGDQIACFPSAQSPIPFSASQLNASGKPIPITLAFAGQTGVIESLDYRGKNVVAAYGPVDNGLSMVAKQETTELYRGIREALLLSIPLMVLIALSGTVLLRFQLLPLTRRLRETEAQLTRLARFDSLTGLPNRYELNAQLEGAVRRMLRSGKPMAVLFMDIDHFKLINDTLGHPAGDAVLKEFAKRLLLAVRTTDTVARLAGDEFVIVLEGLSSQSEAETIARKILEKIRPGWRLGLQYIEITSSIGIAFGAPENIGPEQLLAIADAALYQAKAAGRDCYAVLPCQVDLLDSFR